MIKLTRLDRHETAINCDLIAWIEANPDTTLRMVMGESILVRESVDEVLQLIAGYRSGILRDAGLDVLLTAGSKLSATLVPKLALFAGEDDDGEVDE